MRHFLSVFLNHLPLDIVMVAHTPPNVSHTKSVLTPVKQWYFSTKDSASKCGCKVGLLKARHNPDQPIRNAAEILHPQREGLALEGN